jgi:hypothetical protein
MRLDRHDSDSWALSEGGQPIAIVRAHLGAFYIHRHLSDDRPLGPFRSMLKALQAIEPPRRTRPRPVYVAGQLRRRSFEDG